jgi:hypothetical protein
MKRWHVLGASLLVMGAAQAQENYTQWTGQRSLYLNTTASGANVASNLTRFPVVVRLGLADSAVFRVAKTGGADIRFSKPDGTRLHHQIDSWDSAGRAATLWFLADTIKGNNGSQSVRMHWGKSDAADSSRGTAVFDTANGYVGVWHMNGAANVSDASANGLTAVGPTDSVPGAGAGILGAARTFNGSAQHFSVPHSTKLDITEAITISAWVKATNWSGSTRILVKGLSSNNDAAQYGLRDNSLGQTAMDINGSHNATASDPAVDTWVLIHGTYDGSSVLQYQDGLQVGSTSKSGPINTSTEAIKMGKGVTATPGFLTGSLDEVRLQKVARSQDWIKLEFENQKSAQTLIQLTPVGIRSFVSAKADAGFGISTSGAGVTFVLPEGAGRALLTVSDMRGKVLWSREASLGSHVNWSGKGLTAGTYAASVTVKDGDQTGRTFRKNFSR